MCSCLGFSTFPAFPLKREEADFLAGQFTKPNKGAFLLTWRRFSTYPGRGVPLKIQIRK
jgi:hypothetical protein